MGNTATLGAGQEQHLKALEYANRVRLARARMKRNIAEGELSACLGQIPDFDLAVGVPDAHPAPPGAESKPGGLARPRLEGR